MSEPMVVILSAICEQCGAVFNKPRDADTGRPWPLPRLIAASRVRNGRTKHGNGVCGGTVLWETRPLQAAAGGEGE